MDPHAAGLLLLLLLLTSPAAKGFSREGGAVGVTPYGPASVEISGVGVATVSIQYYFLCTSECYPGCKYSWTRGNETSQGAGLNLKLPDLVPTQTLTCTVHNPTTGEAASVQKTVKVTAGPSNLRIVGPPYLTPGGVSTFRCVASCSPPCNYQWKVKWGEQLLEHATGDSISLSPHTDTILVENLTCRSEEPVSGLYLSKTVEVQVARVSSVSIQGAGVVTMGLRYTFVCSAQCNPQCDYTWTYMGRTYLGDQTEIPIVFQGQRTKVVSHLEVTISSEYSKMELLTCVATNSLSGAAANATKYLTVFDPYAVRPASPALPAAGEAFSLRCVGAQNPASVTWMKSQRPLPASERARFTPDNETLTFSPLLQEDDGLYQCVVVEGAGPHIQSVGYIMKVIYGPDQVLIVNPSDGAAVGESMMVQPGSTTELRCAAACFPTCLVAWFYDGSALSTNASVAFTPATTPNATALSCTAANPLTGKNGSAVTTVEEPEGPVDVVITGPAVLDVGVPARFLCSARCSPPCSFTWTFGGFTAPGAALDVTVNRGAAAASIGCRAENTFSGRTAAVNRTLGVSEPLWCGC